ncbi:putative P-loop containing nucleoside triphosphate hydrolase protein [Lyophyllum shimeji]|uniref:Midasin n=1 Tax=Lyophyllum shimeji TaxID=47721 RepID=A0A9P3UMR6_LYOSH|nr:putative P-loop containing nucleoside triphosphate hydrolase protein [Lyophyllum shimeji]
MASSSDIHDPLSINLRRQTTALLEAISNPSQYTTELHNAATTRQLLATLSRLLALPAFTTTVATLYRPILFDLCARWLDDQENSEDQLAALCLLLENHEELYPILHRILTTSTFAEGPLAFITAGPSPLSIDAPRLHRLLLAYYRILRANRELPRLLVWPLSPLSHLIWTPHLDNGVRLLAIRCYALQSGMGEAEREVMEKEVLGEQYGVDCQMEYGTDLDGTRKEVDGWIMPVIELQRIKDTREKIAYEDHGYYVFDEGESPSHVQPSDLSSHIVNVYGVFLLRTPGPPHTPTSHLISTPTTVKALQTLAMHISLRLPTLLTSPPSSGKSLFLSHLAELIHPGVKNQLVTIHLADTSLDPRALLGSYVSSPTRPGTFEWREGVLVRAMREGRWVVFEDIDRGSNEVLGVIKPLVESLQLGKWIGGRASLQVPGRGRIVAADSFALFATRSIVPSRAGTFSAPVFFGAHKFFEVTISSPTLDELRTILDARFPRLAGNAIQAFIRLWESIKALGRAASARDIGLRELEKFCTRVQRLLPTSHQPMDIDDPESSSTPVSLASIFPNPTLREEMYLEARDVFFGAGTLTAGARAHVESVAQVIADHIGLDPDRRTWVLSGRTPDFELEKDANGTITAVHIGRTRLSARATRKMEMTMSPPGRPFAMHRPAVLLLSRIATAVALAEPVLLTGETGTGKTSVVTHLAGMLRRPLVSLNLSHQTESSDLLGGFKPVDARVPGTALQGRFLDLFGGTFSRRKNEKFEGEVRRAVGEGKWKRAVGLWKESARLARERIQAKGTAERREDVEKETETPRKRRRVDQPELNVSADSWAAFVSDVEEFEVQHVLGKGKFAFGFVEGPLVKALRSGDWVLLDEINLASPETLECISGLLQGPTASITLTEQGSLEPVPRHPDFRLFACMNPATDVGKKDLPPNIRSRFTEIDVPPPDADKETLLSIVSQYIGANAVGDKGAIMNVAEFYAAVKDLAEKRQIADGSNHRPHYSMRTLARALTFASDTASMFGLRRAIWEGCLMAFTMVLDDPSAELVTALAHKHLLAGVRNPRSMLSKEPQVPHGRSADEFVKFGPFYLERGPLPEDPADEYIMTPSVETKLMDLARIILTRRFPILIEGPTSSGKTSSVEYLAKRTGHQFIRINNHEHTDIQEYIGSYVSDPQTGKLVFKDGLLVRALRNGHWIVLDELNLAPTDVLEALNRLLDDNRELVIPETQEVVKPHPHFMLFATQNPPGLYAGRKVLSRAFRNRFLEVHFEDVPQAELETILCQRCQIAPSYGKKIVSVFHELQKRRQSSRVFESKQGFATLRDLFRWAGRNAVGYQELAENGYMLLAERTRREDDKAVVKEVIESIMNVKIDERTMYNIQRPDVDVASFLGCTLPTSSDIIWTNAMQRLFTLVARALRFNEPVLLVGETGAGKTSVCQVFADATSQRLHSLNCHQNTETADLIGGLRPLRNRSAREAELLKEAREVFGDIGVQDVPHSFNGLAHALSNILKANALSSDYRSRIQALHSKVLQLHSIFEWHDGPLVEAIRNGDVFLLDEISLADDSVLERLNSVLEPGRTIVLAEKGGGDDLVHPAIRAHDDFKLIATMNPGGDYGKKELSPALRNRFTEIWVPRVEDRHDLELIVGNLWKHETLKRYTSHLLDFVEWLCSRVGDRTLMSLRDILAWVVFTSSAYRPQSPDCIPADELFHHAAHMTFLDGLASLPQLSAYTREGLQQLKDDAVSKLMDIVPLPDRGTLFAFAPSHDPSVSVQFGTFNIPRGPGQTANHLFNLQAPTTQDNAMRVIRACQVSKPILLEGSPGVGKTSLVAALANISGHRLCRINLSDQTDLIDLFGSDLPVEGGAPGEFAWKDAEFLRALQEGHWVLLDEMNLAPQAVLEGLNAVLDHRGTVYIPELGRSFVRHPSFRIFAAQNPLNQGGGRKGLPKSFVNRFTKVYVEELSPSDLLIVCQHIFPDLDATVIRDMISYNTKLHSAVGIHRRFAREGSPWEFNLRDVIRWGSLLRTSTAPLHPSEHFRTIYLHRFRTEEDRQQALSLFDDVFSADTRPSADAPNLTVASRHIQVGRFVAQRRNSVPWSPAGRVLKMQLSTLESIGHCISRSWLAILTGQRNCGKTQVVRVLAHITGNTLQEISINSATDTMDILGSFEQVDLHGRALALVDDALTLLDDHLRSTTGSRKHQDQVDKLRKAREASTPPRLLLQIASASLTDFKFSEGVSTLLGKIDSLLATSDAVGRFEWVDGPLVRAMKHGHWLLMDGANLCNPSVLDRLNSLCEHDGVLTLSERGYIDGRVEVLRPHRNFRLFMTVDPQYGELSRAMRNRGIEISLISAPTADDPKILSDYQRLPLSSVAGDPESRCLAFEAARRGLHGVGGQPFSSLSTSGRALDQESGLSGLVDQAPMVLLSSCKFSDLTDAHLFFVGRAVAPACLSLLNRLLAHSPHLKNASLARLQALLGMLSDHCAALEPLRDAYSLELALRSDLVLAQPMDFYLSAPPCVDKKLESNIPSAHHIVLQASDLAVALFLDQEDDTNMQSAVPVVQTNEKQNQVLKEIASVLSAIHGAGRGALESLALQQDSGLSVLEMRLSTLLLSYSRHLRRVTTTIFDFSALQAACHWIIDAVENCPQAFVVVASRARALRDSISLSNGLGLMEIWSSLFLDRPLAASSSNLEIVEKRSAALRGGKAKGLRRQAFDFMALQTLPVVLSEHSNSTLLSLQADLESHLLRQDAGEEGPKVESSLLVAELRTFRLPVDVEASMKLISKIVDLACRGHGGLRRMVSYQHLLWSLQAGNNITPVVAQAQIQWLDALWDVSSSHGRLNGPSVLLQPTQLMATVSACDWSRKPLLSFEDYELDVRYHSRLVFLQSDELVPRIDELASFLHQSIILVTSCFSSCFSTSAYEDIRQQRPRSAREFASSANMVLILLQQSSNEAFKRGVLQHLAPPFERLQVQGTRERLVGDLGFCWIAVGTLILDLFVPDAPVDPAVVQNCTTERWRQEQGSLQTQLALHRTLEELTTGSNQSDLLNHLERVLENVCRNLSNAPSLPVRNDISRLNMFWSEVSQFRNQVLTASRIRELSQLLESRNENAILREEVLQQSISGFCQRLRTVYAEYADLSTPLLLATHYVRLGLRLVTHSALQAFPLSTSQAASMLIAFPSVRSSAAVCADVGTAGPSEVAPFLSLLLTLSAVAMQKSLGILRTDVIEMAYGQAVRLWLIDRAKEKEANMAASSLYRRKNLDHDDVGEAEMEEQEFLSLFPTFEGVLEPEANKSAEKPTKTSALVPDAEMGRLLSLHLALFDSENQFTDSIDFNSIRRSILTSMMSSAYPSLPDTLDNESLPFQFDLLHDRLSSLAKKPTVEGYAYNFYADPNVAEVKKAAIVVSALRSRLEALIQEWPDQMVLQHLKSRCDVVLELDLDSPVAKILSALEQLLLQTEDWEIYANRENTLKTHQQGLIGLIVEWRRLELSCWQVLLEAQSRTFAEGVAEWWFRLYDATIRGTLDVCEREVDGASQGLDQYLETLIPLLDDFVRTSPLGQFAARMRLLRSFEIYVQHLCDRKSDHQQFTLDRIRRILSSTRRYYDLFSARVASHLAEQRGALEKEIRGFIKLASWKDINVQALKASAQRTHHQLYKIIRKFRDVLRQPVSEHLQPQLADLAETKSLNLELVAVDSCHPRPLLDGEPGLMSAAQQTESTQIFAKFDSYVANRIRSFIHSKSAHIVDTLAVDIIVSAKDLAALSVPSGVPAEKQRKQQKAILVRKRKAWSDLLKELKQAGFAANVKPDVLHRNADSRLLREQPTMPEANDPAMSTQKGEHYFARLCGLLPELRSSLSTHHSDLTTRELQRGIMLLESGFSIGIDLRSRLAIALGKFRKLEQMAKRLRMLSCDAKALLSGSNLIHHVESVNDVLCRLVKSLQEILDGMQTYNALEPEIPVSDPLMQEVRGVCQATVEQQGRLKAVVENVKLASPPMLLEKEHETLRAARGHISDTISIQTCTRVAECSERSSSYTAPTATPPSNESADSLITTFLVTVQNLMSRCPDPAPDVEEENDQYILQDYRVVRDFTHLLNLDAVTSGLENTLQRLIAAPDSREQDLRRILPFLATYLGLVKDQLATHSQWTKAVFKLDFVLCSVLSTLSKQGFCQPPEVDENDEGGEASETTGGVGLGEGSGTENVSKEIEDESQVEGLQGDDAQEREPRKEQDEDDAIEMSEDFGGEMEDVPDSGSEDGAEPDDESDVEPEERLGNLDPSDPSALDEKLWGDEKGPEDGKQDDKTDQDRSAEKGGESEVVAKESKDKSKEKEKGARDKEATEEEANAEDEPVPEVVEEEEEDANNPDASGAPMDDYVQDANTLDLPENMDLGGDDIEMGGEDIPEDTEGDEEEVVDEKVEETEAEQGKDEAPTEQWGQEDRIPDEAPEPMDQDQDPEFPNQFQETDGDDQAAEDEDDAGGEEAVARPDVSSGDGAASAEDAPDLERGDSAATGQAGGSEGTAGKDTASRNQAKDNDGLPEANEAPVDDLNVDTEAAGAASSGSQDGQMPSQPESQSSANPLRSLGDALKEIRQRFDDIISGEQRDVPRERAGDVDAPSQVEYLQPDDADHDMEALGPAGEEQVAKLNDLKLIDGDDEPGEAAPMDIDIPLEPEERQQLPQDHMPNGDPTSSENREDIEGAILQGARPMTDQPALASDASTHKADVDMEEEAGEAVEAELRSWQTRGFPEAGAEKVWRLYESLTHDLAYALCEQLRLILEPTLATRLKGDYRTGKRLNMKKIISYIASDYTKDKIWLRRTRPSQREYQVLISIDDSRSMAESHSVHLAYQTLALVSKALSRLEAGDIAIAKFGETVDILHGFDEGPFTDQSGIKVMSAFRFNQKATNVLSLVETSLKVLETARERRSMSSATAADLWQLQFIISDGMCQDHERLRTVLRKAEEQRVMIVFVIVDSLHTKAGNGSGSDAAQSGAHQGSILTMDKAEFKNVDGRMELQLQKYLDSFPFEYYVVLRNVEALPEVLASTLKQFFERISEE